ncbi:MAG: NAD-dependent epimerase/dehydratase family protein [Woeseiaceae bacterium]|nr:NAD-dependent epimerase/dehydratase family protein [Woeseiaceae bacterium]
MLTVVAGTGYTGRRVLEGLPEGEVIGLSRTAIETTRPFHTVDFDAMEAFPFEISTPYAIVHTVPPGGADDRRLQGFLDRLPGTPKRFVYLSTTGVYGDCGGAVVDEDTPVNPGSRLSKPRVAAENRLSAWASENDCDVVVLRVPGIYGPGRLGLERLRERVPVLVEAEANPGNRIHVDDLARCCVAALSRAVPAGVYNVGDGDHRTSTWFADEVARQAALPLPPKISREEAARTFSPTRLAFLASSRVVDTTRMREILGVTPGYEDPVEGIRASLEQQRV